MNLTLDEVKAVTGWKRAWIFECLDNGKLEKSDEVRLSQKNVALTLIALHSLPADAQRRYLETLGHKLLGKAGFNHGADYGISELANTPETLELALRRFEFVQQMEKAGCQAERHKIAKATGEHLSTLYRWKKRWMETHSIVSLVRKSRADRGSFRQFSEDAITFMMAAYYKSESKRHAYSELVKEAVKHAGEWFVGSYSRACDIINERCNNGVLIATQRGARGIADQVVPSILRTAPEFPNERWCGDHHQCDVFVRLHNRLVRPWITVWLDEGTRAIVGYCINESPSSKTISIALRHGILRKPDDDTPFHGIPTEVHIDNGKDYISNYLSGNTWRRKHHKVMIDLETEGVFAELGITPIYAGAYNAKSKRIERLFGTIEEQFGQFLPGYCGPNTSNKPVAFKDMWTRYSQKSDGWHREWLTWEMFVEQFKAYVRKYNNQVHRSIKMKPTEKWSECVHHGFVPREISSSKLDPLLMKAKSRRVTNQGIQMAGLQGRYRNFEALLPIIGEMVMVRFDPMNLESIQVYHNDEFLCTATYESPVAHGAKQEIGMKIAEQKRQRRLVKEMADEAQTALEGNTERVDTGTVIEDNPKSTIDNSQSEITERNDDEDLYEIWEEK